MASLGVTTFTLCACAYDRFSARKQHPNVLRDDRKLHLHYSHANVIWLGAMLLALPELLIWQLEKEEREPPEGYLCEHCVVRISNGSPRHTYCSTYLQQCSPVWTGYFGCYFCLPTLFTIISSWWPHVKSAKPSAPASEANASRPTGKAKWTALWLLWLSYTRFA